MDRVVHLKAPWPLKAMHVADLALTGELVVPAQATGMALLFHCNSCDRLGRRAANVAQVFQSHHLATLRFDLRAETECEHAQACIDGLPNHVSLGQRVTQVLDWVAANPALRGLPLGLFGIAAGATAALVAAALRPLSVSAIVCSGGRPQLTSAGMTRVRVPTLLIVGAQDTVALNLNRAALRLLKCKKRLEVVPGASQSFDEPEALESVSELSAVWLENHLVHRGHD
jgi:putative phosphoribosyl transferase